MRNKKALILSYHNWNTKRRGGIHVIAETLVEDDFDVIFWSVSRPLIRAFFSRDERLEYKTVKKLIPRKKPKFIYGRLENIAFFSLELIGERKIPGIFIINKVARNLLWNRVYNYLKRRNFEPDLIIIESCEALYYFRKIRAKFKYAKVIYRVSDPIIGWKKASSHLVEAERIILNEADLVLPCNYETIDAYKKNRIFPKAEIRVLENCVDFDLLKIEYPKPKYIKNFKDKTIFCYAGAKEPDWDLVLLLADKLFDCIIMVICPIYPPRKTIRKIDLYKNIIYIPGVHYSDVPSYIQHSNVIILPYPQEVLKMPLNLHVKILQAMALAKPVIAINIGSQFREYGLFVAKEKYEFIEMCKKARTIKYKDYHIDLDYFSIKRFKKEFKDCIKSLME